MNCAPTVFMTFNSDIHHRHSIRLRDYDYAQAGAYFVTICVQGRKCLFGAVEGGEVVLNAAGAMVRATWDRLPARFPGVDLDEFVVMPNHVHGIVWIANERGATPMGSMGQGAMEKGAMEKGAMEKGAMEKGAMEKGAMNRAPTPNVATVGARFIAPASARPDNNHPALGEIIRTLKAVSTRNIRRDLLPEFGWQRNYHERIIRDEPELSAIRAYIRDNPGRWAEDAENPENAR